MSRPSLSAVAIDGRLVVSLARVPLDKIEHVATALQEVLCDGIIGQPPTLHGVPVRSEPWQLGHGQWVVKIAGVSGGVAVEALRQSKEVG